MKMAISVESSAGVHSALRDSIANSTSTNQQDNNEHLTNKIIAIAKKILLTKIEYEEVNNYDQSVLETFKSKYTVLKPINSGKSIQQNETTSNGNEKSQQNSSLLHNYQHQSSQKNANELPLPKRILFPRDNVQIGWRSSGRKWQVGSGMMNVGNTCYLNSTLQALFHVPAMANWLISDSEHREGSKNENGMQDNCIICAMAKTLLASQVSSSPIRPQFVYSRLKQICKHLTLGRQEDAHEFLRYLVEAMEKSYLQRFKNFKELDQYSKETTPLNQILGGYLKTSVRCLSCGHVSTTFQHFQDLLLDIRKPNTIEEALDGYFAKERLEDMGYKCESCKKKVSAIKQYALERAPISLCIQLKRFSMAGTKMNKYIAIRPRLDLTKYATKKIGNEQLTYKLVAMVTHLGVSQNCGHYTAIGLTEQGVYYQFDDSCVRPISLQNVLSTNAYIIFYELDESQHSKPVCTQVSGENELFKEDYLKSNDSILNQHKHNGNYTVGNGDNATNNGNSAFGPKNNGKLDFVQTGRCDIQNNNNFIGPQLPPENTKSNYTKKIQSNQNGSIYPNSLNGNDTKLVYANQNNSFNKQSIVFKNTTSSSTGTLKVNSVKEITSNDSNNTQNGASKEPSTGLCKENLSCLVQKENVGEERTDENKKSFSLPSMPKLDANTEKISPLSNSDNTLTQTTASPTKRVPVWSPKSVVKQTLPNGSEDKPLINGIQNSPIKSLVPYGSDADDDSNASSEDEIVKDESANTAKEKNSFSTSNETTPDSSPESKSTKSNPPSPHVVKTKAGLWQVTPITPNVSPTIKNDDKQKTSKTLPNPFAEGGCSIPTSNFYSEKRHSNEHVADEKSQTVKELTKFSHRGYGAAVLSWSGTKSEMEMVVSEEIRQERKRQIQDEDENDLDRGRQKKIKNNAYNRQNESNPGYNPFQEQQLQKNTEHNRQNWNSSNNNNNNNNNNHNNNNNNNRNANKLNNAIRYHYQNNFNANYNGETSNNNNNNSNNTNYDNKNKDNISNNGNKINKFKTNNNSNSLGMSIGNHKRNNHNKMNNHNKNNNKHNGKINNNGFYRSDMNGNFNGNTANNCSKNNFNHNGGNFMNRNQNGNSNFFRRHNTKKFNANQRSNHHQKNGEWR